MKRFRDRIRSALANPDLQAALDANAERRIKARQEAFACLPDAQALRQRAHSVRAEVIANLDGYLEQFIARARSNGLIIHQAADAAQANQIVLDIARENKARRIAKAKTMTGEEINLNHVLQGAGLEVVETDLGEYIVQLRGERPAHILTPAVHLRRHEVGQTFHEKLGLPFTEDVPTLTSAARRILRQVFLSADIGISGVNFGVAETGTLCIVTNEGNGRMVTTLPPIHIALMGIERLVPTLDDLALMLTLLPRSASGQKITVYTNLIHGPRTPNDPDGPRERHLILLDNGRRALHNSVLTEALYCIRCGACLNACPVFREIGGHAYVDIHGEGSPYPGPIGAVLSPALFGQSEFGHLARASSLCGACREACPVDIDLPKLLLRVRSGGIKPDVKLAHRQVPATLRWGLDFFTWIATHPKRFAAAQRLAGFGSKLLSPSDPWLRLPAITGWGFSKDFPRPAVRPFHARWKGIRVSPAPAHQATLPVFTEGDLDKQENRAHNNELLARFTAELTALGGTFTLCDKEDLVQQLLSILHQRDISTILTWEEGEERPALPSGLLKSLQVSGIQVFHTPEPSIPAGLTGALAAVAETGSLLLASGPGKPLSASLLPEIHIAILSRQDIYENLAQVFQASDDHLREIRDATALSIVSGPSRTADIEMTLTIGVHGPKEVHVLVIP